MAVNIGINGFGRIGRYLLRLVADHPEINITVVNARSSSAELAHLFKYDSVHGTFAGEVSCDDSNMIVNGRKVAVTKAAIGEWDWKGLGVDIVVETTGKIKDGPGMRQHLAKGAKKAIISAPAKDVDFTVVMGVNHKDYDPAKHHVISNASCTTNCLGPVAKVLNDNFGIEHGLMTTVHSYTMSQRILDGSHKDLRRARAACMSMIPTTTGAAKAIGLVIPELKGKLDGMAIRVPTPNVSLVDFTCRMKKDVTAEEINACLKNAAATSMKDYMGYCDEPLVSVDFNGSTYGGVVDSLCTSVMDKRMLKLLIWYDNEAGFTNQLFRLLHMVNDSM